MKQPERNTQVKLTHRNQGVIFSIIGRLIPNIVHEINNPMQAIRGGTILAQEEMGNDVNVSNYLRIILHESDRILELTSFLQSLYSDKSAMPGIHDLVKLVDQSMILLKDDLNQKGLRLELVQPQTSVWINASKREVLLSLIELVLSSNQALHGLGKDKYLIRFITNPTTSSFQLEYDFPIGFLSSSDRTMVSDVENTIDIRVVEKLLLPCSGRLVFSTDKQSKLLVEFPRVENIGKLEETNEK